MSLRNLAYRLRRYKDHIPTTIERLIEEQADFIVGCIRQQLSEGEDGKKVELAMIRPYALSTVFLKLSKGQEASRVTLRDTGAFYRSLYLEKDNAGFFIASTDSKAQYLVSKYGPSILRLNNQHFNELVNIIRLKL